MSSNMHDNKVSEKVIWEDYVGPDNDDTPIVPQVQTQPQMMFCYKCNNIIPQDSKFCPYCQTELYVTCPKCGLKYSSQYPMCNQCGTNRTEYLLLQRKEQERIETRKREEAKRQRENERRLKEAQEVYKTENENIVKTEEFQILYSLLTESLSHFRTRWIIGIVLLIVATILSFTSLFFSNIIPQSWSWVVFFIPIITNGFLLALYHFVAYKEEKKSKFIVRYMYRKVGYDKDMFEYVIKHDQVEVELHRLCINAYRNKKGLYINDTWY